MKILCQRDKKWADIKLGSSDLKIGDYGCLITSLSMVADTTPDVFNGKLRVVKGFSWALVIWSKIQSAFPRLKFVWRSNVYDNNAVLSQIKRNGFCLVEAKRRFTNSKHWVLFIGGKRLFDPWTGTERNTSVFSNLFWRYSGFCAIDKC